MCRISLLLFILIMVACVGIAAAELDSTEPVAEPPVVIDEGGKVENPPDQLRLKYKYLDGQNQRYQVQIMNRGSYRLLNSDKEQQLDTVTEMFFKQNVKAEEDGLYKVMWSLQAGTVRIPDFGDSVITLPDVLYTTDDRGVIKKVAGLEKLALLPGKPQQKSLASIFGQMSFHGFPDKDIKIGDEWEQDYSVAINEKDKIDAKTRSKLLGYERYDGYDCALIETKYSYPLKYEITDRINGKLTLEGTESAAINTRFAYAEGKLIRSEADITSDAKVTRANGSSGAFVKLQLNVVGLLLPSKTDTKGGG